MDGFMKILGLARWKIEIILITDELCQLDKKMPISFYQEKVINKRIAKAVEISDLSDLEKTINALELIIKQLEYLPERIKTKVKFKTECIMHLAGFKRFKKRTLKVGRKSVDNSVAYNLLAVIEQSKIPKILKKSERIEKQSLTDDLYNFLCTDGEFWKWLQWRFGDINLPFHMPVLQKTNPHSKNYFKDKLKETLMDTKLRNLKENGKQKSKSECFIIINETVELYRKILFETDAVDTINLGLLSRKSLIVDNINGLF